MDKELIYCLEDDVDISDLLKYAIADAGYDVVCFDNPTNLIKALKQKIPMLMLLDIMIEGSNIDGIDVLKKIRADYSNVDIKIIMLSSKSNEMNKVNALNLGADDYITKPFSVLELIARIKANLRKKSVENKKEAIEYFDIKMNIYERSVFIAQDEIVLTYKEFELLKVLLLNAGNIIAREKLFNEVWGYDVVIETRTLDMHIKNLREKLLHKKNIISTVRGVGYRLVWV